jgi:predicted ATP-grasp superfamily ATP-dependent carboligase
MNFIGIGEVELAYVAAQLYLIEINPRPWLQYGLAQSLGFSLLGFLALGDSPMETSRTASWLDIRSDLQWCMSRKDGLVWNGSLPLKRYFCQIVAADCHPLWHWRDPAPFLRTALRLLRHRAVALNPFDAD